MKKFWNFSASTVTRILLVTLIGLEISAKPVLSNENLIRCLKQNEIGASIESSTNDSQFDYYMVVVQTKMTGVYPSVFRLDRKGNCNRIVTQEQIHLYPLTNFLGKAIARDLLLKKYQAYIDYLGGKEAFLAALTEELEAGVPHPFFFDEVEVLKELGIDLEQEDSMLVIVGEEGIPAHPELQNR